MNENNFDPKTTADDAHIEKAENTEMFVNDYGSTVDPTVVVEEPDRTVLLTENETIVIEKQPTIDIAPKNRPRKVYGGMWGQTEIATVGVGLLAILTVILLFVFLVIPAQKELEANRTERDRLERELTTARSRYGSITTTEAGVARLVSSVDDFETRFLPSATNGRTAIYQRINGLISAYGLTNTTGPDYAPLEIADRGNNGQVSEEESGRAKFQSIFPGVYVTATLEGSYQNLRRFIREIETSEQFVVVSAVELEPSENNEKENQSQNGAAQASVPTAPTAPPAGQFARPNDNFGMGTSAVQPIQPGQAQQTSARPRPSANKGKTHGETVSLRLEMAAYFRRPNFVPRAVESMEQ
jgi:Tfp pilus assembly protein PilO